MTRRSPRCASLSARLAGLLAAVIAPASAEAARRTIAPSAAPAAWVNYAEAVTGTVAGWLGEPGEPATRLRAYLDATRPAGDQPSAPLVLKLWIARDGRVTRVDSAPFVQEDANADLRAAIVGRTLAAPPKKMLLPLRLAIQLEPAAP